MTPTAGTTLAIARNTDEMIEAFCVVKNQLQLSNAFIEAMGLLADGHVDKVLGPTRAKSLSPMIMDLLFETLAVEVHFHVNLDAAKRMESRWEGREQRNVRFDTRPPSKKIIERAKSHVLKGAGRAGGLARAIALSATKQTEIAKKANRARNRLPKAVRSEISRKGWIKRRKKASTLPSTLVPTINGAHAGQTIPKCQMVLAPGQARQAPSPIANAADRLADARSVHPVP